MQMSEDILRRPVVVIPMVLTAKLCIIQNLSLQKVQHTLSSFERSDNLTAFILSPFGESNECLFALFL